MFLDQRWIVVLTKGVQLFPAKSKLFLQIESVQTHINSTIARAVHVLNCNQGTQNTFAPCFLTTSFQAISITQQIFLRGCFTRVSGINANKLLTRCLRHTFWKSTNANLSRSSCESAAQTQLLSVSSTSAYSQGRSSTAPGGTALGCLKSPKVGFEGDQKVKTNR